MVGELGSYECLVGTDSMASVHKLLFYDFDSSAGASLSTLNLNLERFSFNGCTSYEFLGVGWNAISTLAILITVNDSSVCTCSNPLLPFLS